jgi:hypothetical protein
MNYFGDRAMGVDEGLRRSVLVKTVAFIAVASFVVRLVRPFLATGEL